MGLAAAAFYGTGILTVLFLAFFFVPQGLRGPVEILYDTYL